MSVLSQIVIGTLFVAAVWCSYFSGYYFGRAAGAKRVWKLLMEDRSQ